MVDLSNAISGAISGAGTGSLFAGVPGAIGGGILGFGAGLLDFGKGKKPKIQEHQNYQPNQLELINSIIEQAKAGNKSALDWINNILSDEEGAFEDYERPFMEHFNETIVPSIMERFRGGGSKNSSGLQQSLAQGARGLQTQLAGQRSSLKEQAINALRNYNQTALGKQTTPYMTSGTPSIWEMISPSLGNAARSFTSGGL